ncbi:MAG: PEP-CTERM sorting domain-containing protein [Fimbriimonadaceae bacterium]|nr:PEP-CTERM sorting domain-containing protein [Fimbriimonadaceae bacterium]
MKMQRLFVLALATVASSAFAQTTFDFTSENINSNDALDAAGNEHRSVGAGASYLFGSTISIISGTLTEVNVGTFASEARVQITNNNTGKTGLIQFTSLGDFTGSTNLAAGNAFGLTGNIVGSAVNAGDTFDLEFYESFDDSGAGLADAVWSNLKFSSTVFVPPTPPPSTELGLINDLTPVYTTPDVSASHTGGAIKWYKFSHAGASNGAGTFLDIDTEGSGFDTEIGLYDALGNLIANDDDDGSGSTSQLTWGLTAPTRTLGTSVGGNGRDGTLAAGVYYLAVGGFNTTFAGGFNATTTSTNTTGNVNVNFRTNAVPEPGTMAALGLGALALIRRRRNSK